MSESCFMVAGPAKRVAVDCVSERAEKWRKAVGRMRRELLKRLAENCIAQKRHEVII